MDIFHVFLNCENVAKSRKASPIGVADTLLVSP